jgi:hypothetical protein
MTIDTTIYSSAYIQRRATWRPAYEVLADVFANRFGLGTIVDVGCAGGLLVESLRKRGYEAWGIDGAPASERLWPPDRRAYYLLADLTRVDGVDLPPTDFVCSLEVAEHLPAAAAAGYVALLVRHAPKRILFTAASIGQPGLGHVNCQFFSYWMGLFLAHGYALDVPRCCAVRADLRAMVDSVGRPMVPAWYTNNFLTFAPQAAIDAAAAGTGGAAVDAVHLELAKQEDLLRYLVQRTANVTELIAFLRRSLGEATELPEDDAHKLQPYVTNSL